jgi:hypothetical protein
MCTSTTQASDAFDEKKIVDAEQGYKGSSQDHFYVSKGTNTNDAVLLRRKDICTCIPCLKGGKNFKACLLKHIFPLPNEVRIKPRSINERATTRGGVTLKDFCGKLVKGDVVVARIHQSERAQEHPEDDYFLGCLQEKPYKLIDAGIYGGNRFNKGWYVVRMQWYESKGEDQSGNLLFEKGHSQLLQCNVFVRGLRQKIFLTYNQRSKLYQLDQSLDAHIQKYGALSS